MAPSVASEYRREADALDQAICDFIELREPRCFGELALRIFAHQLKYNVPYARYCATKGFTSEALPASWEQIVAAPAAAYKEAALCTFDPSRAALCFESSGTTRGVPSRHYMENPALYDASLLAGFEDGVLRHGARTLRYILLIPNPWERPHSSLGYMMRRVAEHFGDGDAAWCIEGDRLEADRAVRAIRRAQFDGVAVCIAATSFALMAFLEELSRRDLGLIRLPPGSLIVPTGGFKGRTRVVSRDELYERVCERFGIGRNAIVAEYGMAELSSQYYEDEGGVMRAPPWLRARIVDSQGRDVAAGASGILVHVDLANRSSCVAVQTQDVGIATGDGGFVLLGRETEAEPRGCSLHAESLLAGG